MKSYEAMHNAIAGKTISHAKNLGLATITLNKWQEPSSDFSDPGIYNPLDRIESICRHSLELGTNRQDALAPVYWLNHRFGLVCFDLPDITRGGAVAAELIKTIKEFSDLTQATSDALGHSRIDKQHAAHIIKEGEEALRAIGALIGIIKEMTE